MKLQSSFYKVLILFFSAINSSAQITTIGDIPLPEGYKRTEAATNSFGSYLRRIQLKKDKTVYLYDGKKKANQSVQYAVLNVSIGLKDLQQCADAVMRLRAEYLRSINLPVCFTDNANK